MHNKTPVQTSFGKMADIWDAKVGTDGSSIASITEQLPSIFAMLGNLKNKKVYEIACGNGFLSRLLVKQGVKEITASDISKELITLAKTKYGSSQINYMVREGTNFTRLQRNSFDAVVIHQGIFYIEDLDALFKGITKILKPGGVLVYNFIHPLFPVMRASVYKLSPEENITNILNQSKKYHKDYTLKINKTWRVDEIDHKVSYSSFKRPIHTYINTASKHGLLTFQIDEPISKSKVLGKIRTSLIPSTVIVKCVKI